MEPVELHYCLSYKTEVEQNKQKLFSQIIFESMRLQTIRLLQANPYIKRKPKKLTDVFRFTWDKKEQQPWQDLLNTFGGFAECHNKKLKENK